ncbi:MAG: putative secreted protein, partial [Acidimicrobiales bacterium]|nr:putative secreted protein [Acidimicrobiales bacterium]
GAGKRRAPTLVDCKQFSVDAVVASTESREHGLQPYLVPGYTNEQVGRATGWLRCQKVNGGGSVGFLTGLNAPPVPAIATVVALAEAKVKPRVPEVVTSPPRRGPQLVSVPIWFWSTDQPIAEMASIPGLAATVTAKPVDLRVEISGGHTKAAADNVTLECPGTGTPYDKHKHGVMASSDCSHAFDWNGTFTITATVHWTLSWTATNGQTGTLPDQHRTTTFTLTVEQAQAVTD